MELLLAALLSLATLALLLGLAADIARVLLRPALSPPAPSADLPTVSLLIPARNEERAIARCVAGALAQAYPRCEVLVVDDGSTDATPQILAELAAAEPRLRVLPGRALPPGWTGKCNVCQQLAEAACGEWLLFLDADTAPGPELTAAMLAHARRHRLDALTVFPFLELGSFWERLILPAFLDLITAIFPLARMASPDVPPEEVLANGQCILVRRRAYEAIGGHGAVRGEVLEDVKLAQALRRAGFRIAAADGPAYLRVRMYTSGSEVAAGLAKNAAAGYRSGGPRSVLAATRQLCLAFGPLWLLAAGLLAAGRGDPFGYAALAHGVVAVATAAAAWGWQRRRLYGLSPLYGLLHPLGVMAYMLIATRAMWRVRRGSGVVWKGRSYSG